MANTYNIDVPVDLNFNLNTYANKYLNDDETNDNPVTALNFVSEYYDTEQLHTHFGLNKFEYSTLHLNVQSLAAKFDKVKLLINELHDQHIDLDFIMLCETFL